MVGDDDEPEVPTVDSVEVGEDGAIRWSTTGPNEDRGDGTSTFQVASGFMGGKGPTVRRRDEDGSEVAEDSDDDG